METPVFSTDSYAFSFSLNMLPKLIQLGEHPPGADDGSRTHLIGLGSRSSTDKLHPQQTYIN